jgi:transposase
MTDHDVLYGYRLALFDLAGRTSVSDACRSFGVHRSTFYRWKRQVERHGLVMLRPRERRRPRMPNQLSQVVEQRIVAFALGHPGYGPDRITAEISRSKWGGLVVSPNGVWRVLRRHGLNTQAKRLALIAGYQASYEPPPDALPEPHIVVKRPGELVGMDCFFVGRLRGTKHPVWQVTAIDCYSSYAWADLVTCPTGQPTAARTSKLARRVASDLAQAGWKLERVLTEMATSSKPASITYSPAARSATPASVPAAPKPTATSNDCTKPSSTSAGDPASPATSTSATAACAETSPNTSSSTTPTAPTQAASPKAESRSTSSTPPTKSDPDHDHQLSASLGESPD